MAGAARRVADRLALVRGIIRVAAGPAAAWRAVRLAAAGKGLATPGEAVGIPMKDLGGEEVFLRPGTSDLSNAVGYYGKHIQMPPPGLPEPGFIVELGTNCGVALTALGIAYPGARLLGVEADPVNVAAARKNTARFGERCEVVEGAVWDETTELVLVESAEHGSHGTSVRAAEPGDPSGWTRMSGSTIDDLFARHVPADVQVGYMHVSIEGAEPRVFAAGGAWPGRVESLRVELHPYFGYTAAECIPQLEELGYRAWEAPDPPSKWVFAVRR